MSKHETDDILHDLRDALNGVDASAGFAARVRARIDTEPTGLFTGRWAVMVTTMAVVVLVAGVFVFRSMEMNPNQVTAVHEAAAASPVVRPAAAAVEPTVTAQEQAVVRAAGTAPVVAVSNPRRGTADVRARREPEVLVSPDQAILLRQLLIAVNEGRVVLAAPDPTFNDPIVIQALQDPEPIVIPALRIEPLPMSFGS